MIDPRRYARVMGYSHGQATGHSRRAAHRQATGGQATAMQPHFRHACSRFTATQSAGSQHRNETLIPERGALHTRPIRTPQTAPTASNPIRSELCFKGGLVSFDRLAKRFAAI
jgi:hypothetical protein